MRGTLKEGHGREGKRSRCVMRMRKGGDGCALGREDFSSGESLLSESSFSLVAATLSSPLESPTAEGGRCGICVRAVRRSIAPSEGGCRRRRKKKTKRRRGRAGREVPPPYQEDSSAFPLCTSRTLNPMFLTQDLTCSKPIQRFLSRLPRLVWEKIATKRIFALPPFCWSS